ncbi:MAG: hypothetical protein L0H23_00665 [Luteimonas sp.]|nr:hypothetical protein [Luteimonas sp.]
MALEINIASRPPLGSLWDGLSPHLIAKFYPVRQYTPIEGEAAGPWLAVPDGPVVAAPLTESSLDVTMNWQSPFEQSGPESSAPALMAMLQSGAIRPVLNSLDAASATVAGTVGLDASTNGIFDRVKSAAASVEGRAGITRLNSTQVFSGMPPVKISVTALFRAWRDAAAEVEAPFNQLMSWALPEKLSEAGPILSRAADYTVTGAGGVADVLVPSKVPTKIGMTYKGSTYAPLVIESIGQPISSPIDSSGRFVELLVPMTLCTLTAIDAADWQRIAGA